MLLLSRRRRPIRGSRTQSSLADAANNAYQLEALFYGVVTDGGVWFPDPQCQAQFAEGGHVPPDQLHALALCVAGLHLEASPRLDALGDVVVIRYPSGPRAIHCYYSRMKRAWLLPLLFACTQPKHHGQSFTDAVQLICDAPAEADSSYWSANLKNTDAIELFETMGTLAPAARQQRLTAALARAKLTSCRRFDPAPPR